MNDPLRDLCDLLGRHVARLAKSVRCDRKPIEDVLCVVARDLVDLADLVTIDREQLPAGPDQEPRNRIGHDDSLTYLATARSVGGPDPSRGGGVGYPRASGSQPPFPRQPQFKAGPARRPHPPSLCIASEVVQTVPTIRSAAEGLG